MDDKGAIPIRKEKSMKRSVFKRIAAMTLAGLMAMTLSACSGGGSSDGLAAIKERGVLKVGVKADVPKFSLQKTDGSGYEGFEDDLAYEIAGRIFDMTGEEAKAEDKVEFQAVNAKTRGPLVENGEVDCVIATFTITPERKETYNFSPAYYTDAVGLLVLKDSGIKDVEDLDGKIIGVAQSSTSQAEFEKYKEENGVKATPTFQEFATYPELAQALAAKQIDVFSVDGAILAGYVNDTNELLDVRYGEQEYGICSNKENEELSELINTTVQEMLDDGSMDALLEKWGL